MHKRPKTLTEITIKCTIKSSYNWNLDFMNKTTILFHIFKIKNPNTITLYN